MFTLVVPVMSISGAPNKEKLVWIFLLLVQLRFCHTHTHGMDRSRSLRNQTSLLGANRSVVADRLLADQPSGADQSNIQVRLSYGINVDRKALITCEVLTGGDTDPRSAFVTKDNRDPVVASQSEWPTMSALYLICPQVTTSVCYMDCTPSCVLGENGCHVPDTISQVIDGCKYERPSPTRLLVSYVVNLESLNISGQWNCDYQGQRALRPLDLRAAERRKPTEPVTTVSPEPIRPWTRSTYGARMTTTATEEQNGKTLEKPTTVTAMNAGATVVTQTTESAGTKAAGSVSLGHSKRNNTPPNHESGSASLMDTMFAPDFSSRSDLSRRDFELFNWKLTRPELVIILIMVLILSLLVNISLSVRCALTKNYLDNLSRGKVDPCLEKVLCLKRHRKVRCAHKSDLVFCSTPNGPGRDMPDMPCTVFSHYAPSVDHSSCNQETMLFFPSNTVNRENGSLAQMYTTEGTLTLASPSLHSRSVAATDMTAGSNDPTAMSLPLHRANFINFGQFGTSVLLPRAAPYGSDGLGSNGVESLARKGVTGTNAGSLTNSIVLTSDSASYTEGIGSNGPSYLLVSSNVQSSNSNKQFTTGNDSIHSTSAYFYSNQMCTDGDQATTTQHPNHSQQQQQQQQRSTLSDSYEDTRVSIRNSNDFSASLTPLLVRLPSGEAGYLICPKRRKSQDQSFMTGSLPKVPRGTAGSHYFPNGTRIRRGSFRQTTNSTLLTTDTDSESGPIDLIRFAQRRADDQSSEHTRGSGRESKTNQNQMDNSLGLKSGGTMELILSRHIPNEFKCSSDDAGTTATNNSLMTIDRSNSEGEGIQNTVQMDSRLGTQSSHGSKQISLERDLIQSELTSKRLMEFVSGRKTPRPLKMLNGHADNDLSAE